MLLTIPQRDVTAYLSLIEVTERIKKCEAFSELKKNKYVECIKQLLDLWLKESIEKNDKYRVPVMQIHQQIVEHIASGPTIWTYLQDMLENKIIEFKEGPRGRNSRSILIFPMRGQYRTPSISSYQGEYDRDKFGFTNICHILGEPYETPSLSKFQKNLNLIFSLHSNEWIRLRSINFDELSANITLYPYCMSKPILPALSTQKMEEIMSKKDTIIQYLDNSKNRSTAQKKFLDLPTVEDTSVVFTIDPETGHRTTNKNAVEIYLQQIQLPTIATSQQEIPLWLTELSKIRHSYKCLIEKDNDLSEWLKFVLENITLRQAAEQMLQTCQVQNARNISKKQANNNVIYA